MTTHEKLERHRIEEGVDTYVFTLAELTALINQARKEAAIDELEKLEEDYNIVFVADGYGGHQREEVVLIDKLQARIKALKEGK